MKNLGLLSKEAKEKVVELPIVMRMAVQALLNCVDTIISGKCDEETVIHSLSTLDNNCNGKYSKDDLMNYDEAGDALGFGKTNRVGLKKLLDKNGIKERTIGKIKIGFSRSDIMILKSKIGSQKRYGDSNRK